MKNNELRMKNMTYNPEEIVSRGGISAGEAVIMSKTLPTGELLGLAAEVMRLACPPVFDTCSIVNAKSGRCPVGIPERKSILYCLQRHCLRRPKDASRRESEGSP